MFDNIRVRTTPLTTSLGLAGLEGVIYGETTPSQTSVEVIGELLEDYAINVQLKGQTDTLWFANQLLEFVDHAPGTAIEIGKKRLVRTPSGEWKEA